MAVTKVRGIGSLGLASSSFIFYYLLIFLLIIICSWCFLGNFDYSLIIFLHSFISIFVLRFSIVSILPLLPRFLRLRLRSFLLPLPPPSTFRVYRFLKINITRFFFRTWKKIYCRDVRSCNYYCNRIKKKNRFRSFSSVHWAFAALVSFLQYYDVWKKNVFF